MQVLELWAWEFKPWCWIGWNKHNINARDNTYLSTATIVSGNASGLDHQKSSAETQKKIRFWIWQPGHFPAPDPDWDHLELRNDKKEDEEEPDSLRVKSFSCSRPWLGSPRAWKRQARGGRRTWFIMSDDWQFAPDPDWDHQVHSWVVLVRVLSNQSSFLSATPFPQVVMQHTPAPTSPVPGRVTHQSWNKTDLDFPSHYVTTTLHHHIHNFQHHHIQVPLMRAPPPLHITSTPQELVKLLRIKVKLICKLLWD